MTERATGAQLLQQISGNILTPEGWFNGRIGFGEKISAISGAACDPGANGDHYIIPGFVDLHVHGGGGADIMQGGDAANVVAAMHARHGTTSLLATTMTAPPDQVLAALSAIGQACGQRGRGAARILGVHLEGP